MMKSIFSKNPNEGCPYGTKAVSLVELIYQAEVPTGLAGSKYSYITNNYVPMGQ
jgi:hypothetical protein